jgi:alpha-methylacyl-CoA racemase
MKIVEFAGIGPGPYCGMILADLGAEVIRIDRPGADRSLDDIHSRGRRSVVLNLKRPEAVEAALRMCERSEALIEGFRPGVMERLGLGPEVVQARNPSLVFGRVTGWGQDGPLAQAAGHDPNYIALTGALHAIGRSGEPPTLPLNLIGDYAGGGLLLAFGVLAAIIEARSSGKGQVVDAAMVDGAATLMSVVYSLYAAGRYVDEREANLLDGGSHFNNVYETKDGRYISVCALEPKFYRELLDRLGLEPVEFSGQMDRERWPAYRARFAEVFRERTRDQWVEALEGTDACFAPVLSLVEAPGHPHVRARGTFIERRGRVEPAPSPRFSRTPGVVRDGALRVGDDTENVLRECGYDDEELSRLMASD